MHPLTACRLLHVPPPLQLRLVYTAWNDEWPQAEFATNAFAPEVHLYPDGSCACVGGAQRV